MVLSPALLPRHTSPLGGLTRRPNAGIMRTSMAFLARFKTQLPAFGAIATIFRLSRNLWGEFSKNQAPEGSLETRALAWETRSDGMLNIRRSFSPCGGALTT